MVRPSVRLFRPSVRSVRRTPLLTKICSFVRSFRCSLPACARAGLSLNGSIQCDGRRERTKPASDGLAPARPAPRTPSVHFVLRYSGPRGRCRRACVRVRASVGVRWFSAARPSTRAGTHARTTYHRSVGCGLSRRGPTTHLQRAWQFTIDVCISCHRTHGVMIPSICLRRSVASGFPMGTWIVLRSERQTRRFKK